MVPAVCGLIILYPCRNAFGDADLPILVLIGPRKQESSFPNTYTHLKKKKNPLQKQFIDTFIWIIAYVTVQCDTLLN